MTDSVILLVAYAAFARGIALALELPLNWDEDTVIGYLVSLPCFTVLAFIAKDNIAKTKRRRAAPAF